MADEYGDFIRQLVADTEALPKAKPPTGLSAWMNHPGIISYEAKSPEQYDQDQRRKYFLDKLSDYAGEYPAGRVRDLPLQQALMSYRSGEYPDLGSAYEDRFWDGRNPLIKGMQWFASMPATAYNAALSLGNMVDPEARPYPDAEKNLARSINTLTMGGAEDAGHVPKGTGYIADDYVRENERRGQVPWDMLDPRMAYDVIGTKRQQDIDKSIPAGRQYLEGLGVDPKVALVGGGVMDAMLDPFTATGATLKAARAGGPAMKMLMQDHALGFLPVALETAPAAAQRTNELIDRLRAMRDE